MLVIENKQLANFLEEIKKEYDLKDLRENKFSFKKYFLPAKQNMFSCSKTGKIKSEKAPKKFVLFGLNPTDILALVYLDEIMSKPYKDFFYFQNRNKSIVIGITKNETENISGGDIILQKTENHYIIITNTKKGRDLINKYKYFFEEKNDIYDTETPAKNESETEWKKEMKNLILDPELLKDAVLQSRESKTWEELAEICLGCGICTYVCPICHCFEIEDSVKLNGECVRCKKWDSCVLPSFSKISGGHSFRPTLKDRYYNWFYHKFVRGYLEYGASQCVGCEKCKNYCPAGIDILEVLKKLIQEYKKNK